MTKRVQKYNSCFRKEIKSFSDSSENKSYSESDSVSDSEISDETDSSEEIYHKSKIIKNDFQQSINNVEAHLAVINEYMKIFKKIPNKTKIFEYNSIIFGNVTNRIIDTFEIIAKNNSLIREFLRNKIKNIITDGKFTKPSLKSDLSDVENFKQLYKFMKYDTIIIFDNKYMGKNQICDYKCRLSKLQILQHKLIDYYEQLSVLVKEFYFERDRIYKLNKKFKDSVISSPRFTSYISGGELQVAKLLKQLAMEKYFNKLFFINNYSLPKHKNIIKLRCDFYCILIINGVIIQFVIEFDGLQHYEEIEFFKNSHVSGHQCDILKQYYLMRTNIHLLRIPDTIDLTMSIIENFIVKIINSENYCIVNGIKPKKNLFMDKKPNQALVNFNYFVKKID